MAFQHAYRWCSTTWQDSLTQTNLFHSHSEQSSYHLNEWERKLPRGTTNHSTSGFKVSYKESYCSPQILQGNCTCFGTHKLWEIWLVCWEENIFLVSYSLKAGPKSNMPPCKHKNPIIPLIHPHPPKMPDMSYMLPWQACQELPIPVQERCSQDDGLYGGGGVLKFCSLGLRWHFFRFAFI